MVKIEEGQLRQMLYAASELGAKNVLIAAGLDKSEITRSEACRKYSKRDVDGWINSGKIIPIKRGRRTMLSVMQLETISKTNQLYVKHLMPANAE
jgi:hypothetical protein